MEPFVGMARSGPNLLALEEWEKLGASSGLTAGFTGREGGVSSSPYHSLNLAFHVGDEPEDIKQNRSRVAEAVGFTLADWTCGEQVHGSRVAVVRADDRGKGSLDRESAFQNTDGLVTQVPGVLLTSFYADCVPLYFWDPIEEAVGLAHAGWKGTVAEIARHMVQTMAETYGSKPEAIRAAIGPSIGVCCYEVDERVMSRVRELGLERSGNAGDSGMYIDKGNGKYMLNLKEINRHIMIKAGILPEHIECTTWCTSCSHDFFFSYRKDGGTTGRMASWIGLRKR
ncbi:peptidoglycan editing factor PgeF [Paenibacillus campinasensis]|uniref:Purine nucleoside phosphorylase n=1 Tax=Paenibacillus campinasensis TaxID=66347 RepID=A0A268F4T5_9BACL|nr:peptidoglycan editing factor PgeF [Paenibacillus campinasensis]PAD80385.1 multicopper polyphenol oxidase [Paenibacillus campinasensis]